MTTTEKPKQKITKKFPPVLVNKLIDTLCELWPEAFNRKWPKPLTKNIHEQILAQQPNIVPALLKQALKQWVNQPLYLKNMAKTEKFRVNLKGEQAEPIAKDHAIWGDMRYKKQKKEYEKQKAEYLERRAKKEAKAKKKEERQRPEDGKQIEKVA